MVQGWHPSCILTRGYAVHQFPLPDLQRAVGLGCIILTPNRMSFTQLCFGCCALSLHQGELFSFQAFLNVQKLSRILFSTSQRIIPCRGSVRLTCVSLQQLIFKNFVCAVSQAIDCIFLFSLVDWKYGAKFSSVQQLMIPFLYTDPASTFILFSLLLSHVPKFLLFISNYIDIVLYLFILMTSGTVSWAW